jgi:carbon storage regulator
MLVLSRKVGERIHVGDNIVLEIRRIAGNRVTLALDAPRNVRILRGELEMAAREFRAPSTCACSDSTPAAAEVPAPAPNRVAVLDHIPVHALTHECAT